VACEMIYRGALEVTPAIGLLRQIIA
jgi:hypothetical protein